MALVFKLPSPPEVAIAGSGDRFPVRRVFCVGRNYAAHAREMGMDPGREPPFFFTKFAECIVPGGGAVPYPPATKDYQYEAELVIALGKGGFQVSAERALDLVFGYGVGLDMTRRDLQFEAREKGRPWDTGKNFSHSAPLGTIHPVAAVGHPGSGPIRLKVNGELKQNADLSELIWSVAEIIAALSAFERLHPGDVIYTGTPAGVGPVKVGDRLLAEIEGLSPLEIVIAAGEAR